MSFKPCPLWFKTACVAICFLYGPSSTLLTDGFIISFKAKVGMLDNLLEIEVAYSLLKMGEDDLAKDPLDVNYEKLQTDLEVN